MLGFYLFSLERSSEGGDEIPDVRKVFGECLNTWIIFQFRILKNSVNERCFTSISVFIIKELYVL
ncbi:MAG: hypothetical protein EGS44_02940 [Akkermansia muciniphila]|nr:hypothetical protein [Akkermansia muciniphila]